MKAKLILESGREIEMELTAEQTEQIRKETKWPQVGDKFFHICSYGDTYEATFHNTSIIEIGNFFQTEKEAQNMVRALRLIEAVRQDRLKINGSWTPDWSRKDETKYSLGYDYYQEALEIDQTTTLQVANVFGYYKSSLDAELIIGRYLPDLEWYCTKFLPERN